MSAQDFFETVNSVNQKLKPPSLFLVIILNDDYTEMGFVIDVLMTIFDKTREEAEHLMLEVHEKGSGIAGRYIYDIAVTKQTQAIMLAERESFPLRITIEEEIE